MLIAAIIVAVGVQPLMEVAAVSLCQSSAVTRAAEEEQIQGSIMGSLTHSAGPDEPHCRMDLLHVLVV